MSIKNTVGGATAALSASLLLWTSAAGAQNAVGPQGPQNASPAGNNDPQGGTAANSVLREVVVTGSRVITNVNLSPTTLTQISAATLQQSTPSNIPDALNKLPMFSGSQSQQTLNNASSNNTGNFLNLRDLGAIRTLILLDGHRLPATAQNGTIDVNTIPQLLLKRVDVVTGGASAVYGSDAVAGVVNFIINNDFNGAAFLGQVGDSSRHDDGSHRFGVAAGEPFCGGRAHIEFSYEEYLSDGVPSKLARPAGQEVYDEEGAGTAADPFVLDSNTRAAYSSAAGEISGTSPANPALTGMEFSPSGALVPFGHGAPTGSKGIEMGGDGIYYDQSSMLAYLKTQQGFGRLDVEFSPSLSAFAEATATQSRNGNTFSDYQIRSVTLSAADPFIPPQAAATLAAAGVNTFGFNRMFLGGPALAIAADTKNTFALVGLNGQIARNVSFSLAYSHGNTQQTVVNIDNTNTGRLYAALDAVDSNGQTVCSVTVTNPGLYPGCVPLNPFGTLQQALPGIDYALNNTMFTLTNKLDDVSGSITATPARLPAGPLTVDVSGEYHRVTLLNVSDAQPTAHVNCTDLRFNCTATSPVDLSNIVSNEQGAESISEGAVEAELPLLKDAPLVKSLSLNGAARLARYSISGNATTWKIGLNWEIDSQVSLRATRSRDIRAPTLNDLFSPVNASPTGFVDTHTGTTGIVTTQSQGNPKLVPEVGETWTAGLLYRPLWLQRFSLSLDYYHTTIGNAIATVGGNNATTLQQCQESNGASPLCALYVRPFPYSNTTAANFPTLIISEELNVASVELNGFDADMHFARPIGAGVFTLRGIVAYEPDLVTVQTPGATPINSAGTAGGPPKWSVTGFAEYTLGRYELDVEERWRGALKQSGNPALLFAQADVPSVAYMDLTATMDLGQFRRVQASAFLSIQDLFDTSAPVYISPAFSANPGFYYPAVTGDDVVGRYFTLGVRARFD